jgi:hypothetical protein
MSINIWAVIVGVVAAFAASNIYYIVFAKQRAALLGQEPGTGMRPQLPKLGGELLRNIVLVLAVNYVLLLQFPLPSVGQSLAIAIVLWIGLPVILLSGSVMWDGVPWRLGAIHAGDWLIKLLLVAGILTAMGLNG